VTVYLVGAGPGAADLLTVRAAALLARADVVVHDRLVSNDVLTLARGARLVDVGKVPGAGDVQASINELLVDLGRRHDCVVRLKGGDPFIFGRGAEEVEALRDAGLEVEVVPGLSSVLAAPLLAGVPLTHRGAARGVVIVTATERDGGADLRSLADPTLTIVVVMGVARRRAVAADLMAGGLSRDTPVAVVERAGTPDQRVVRGVLERLGDLDVSAPAVIIVGAVAGLDLGAVASPGTLCFLSSST